MASRVFKPWPSSVSDSLLGRLYRASPEGLAELVKTVPPQTRAALAVYCLHREHLSSIGLAIAESCERRDLLSQGGSAVWYIIQNLRVTQPPTANGIKRPVAQIPGLRESNPQTAFALSRLWLSPAKAMVTFKHTIAAIASMVAFATVMAIGPLEDAPTVYERDDYATALLIRPLAEHGDAMAQYNLAVMYDQGQGVPQNDAEALKWYRRAADQGHAHAQYTIGNIYDEGRGVKQSDAEAFKWYGLAADQGDADAQFNLGTMYAYGQGLSHYVVNALMWFNLAAAQGNERAVKARKLIAKDLTPEQIAEAQELARDWKPTKQPMDVAEKSAAFYRATFQAGTRRQLVQNNYPLPVAPTIADSPRGETVNHAPPVPERDRRQSALAKISADLSFMFNPAPAEAWGNL